MEYYKEHFQFLIKYKSNCKEHEKQFNKLKMMLLSAQKKNTLSFTSYLIEKRIDGKTVLKFDVMSIYDVIRNANDILLHSQLAYEISTFLQCHNHLGFEVKKVYENYKRW